MKIILSRKGFDSSTGGIPSPIFPDGTFCSLPIPSDQSPCMEEIFFGKRNLGDIIERITQDQEVRKWGVHLDPDLNKDAIPRKRGWAPCFGQVGAAQSHLQNQKVGIGDLFLFFGWFRHVLLDDDGLYFDPDAQDIQCLFGWLQVGSIYHPGVENIDPPIWASDHPHVKDADLFYSKQKNNTLYTATKYLNLLGFENNIAPGGGVFPRFNKRLQLTEPGCTRSIWRLPGGFYPKKGAPTLSFHSDLSRWKKDNQGVLLETVGRGQEFVLDCDFYPEVLNWIKELFIACEIGRKSLF